MDWKLSPCWIRNNKKKKTKNDFRAHLPEQVRLRPKCAREYCTNCVWTHPLWWRWRECRAEIPYRRQPNASIHSEWFASGQPSRTHAVGTGWASKWTEQTEGRENNDQLACISFARECEPYKPAMHQVRMLLWIAWPLHASMPSLWPFRWHRSAQPRQEATECMVLVRTFCTEISVATIQHKLAKIKTNDVMLSGELIARKLWNSIQAKKWKNKNTFSHDKRHKWTKNWFNRSN